MTTATTPQPRQVTDGPYRFQCPCGFGLDCVGSGSSGVDDLGSSTYYRCTEGHRWIWMSTGWDRSMSWRFAGTSGDDCTDVVRWCWLFHEELCGKCRRYEEQQVNRRLREEVGQS